MANKTTDNNEMNLETRLDKLDELIEELEGDDISLEAAFDKYSEGIKLVKECNESIDRVEKKVRLLMDNGETEDFE